MTDHANTYPDLVNVEDWLNAKGYTGEAGACHQAMSLIRKQENLIAELEASLKVKSKRITKMTESLNSHYLIVHEQNIHITKLETENAKLKAKLMAAVGKLCDNATENDFNKINKILSTWDGKR